MGVAWVVLFTVLLAGVGLVFIAIAFKDRVDAGSDDTSRRLPTRREHPLYHLHMKIRSSRKPPSASRAPDEGVAKFPKRQ
jgi:hypothetical protein